MTLIKYKLTNMSENANTIPPSGLWKLRVIDFWKGFIKSCGGLIVGLVIKLIQNKFTIPSYEEIQPLLEATAYFFLAYLGVNAATNNVGQLLKNDKPVVLVPKEKLEELEAKAAEAG